MPTALGAALPVDAWGNCAAAAPKRRLTVEAEARSLLTRGEVLMARQIAVGLVLVLIAGCSEHSGGSSTEGVVNVTGTSIPPTGNYQQAETNTSVQTPSCTPPPCNPPPPIVTTTYNDQTNEASYLQFPLGTRLIFAGASQLGYSVSTNGGTSFAYQPGPKARPPNFGQVGGWDVLWGDPSITNSRAFGQTYVFIANLAVSHASFPFIGGTDKKTGFPGDGKIHGNIEWNLRDDGFPCGAVECSYLDGACIARSTDMGVHFNPVAPSDCFTNSGHFYDGSSMTSTNSGVIFAAFNDVTASTEDVWSAPTPTATFARITPGPFAGMSMLTHPLLRYDYLTDRVYIMAMGCPPGDPGCPGTSQDQNQRTGRLFIDYWNGSSWHGPVTLPTSNAVFAPWVKRGIVQGLPANLRTGQPFSFDIGTASVNQNDDVRIVYTDLRNNGLLELNTIVCTRNLVCLPPIVEWNTGAYPGQQFNPSVIAQPGFINVPAVWKVSYDSTEFDVNGSTLGLLHTTLNVTGTGVHILWLGNALVTNTPLCPDKRTVKVNGINTIEGYWGDYDDLKILSVSGTGTTTFIRTNSNSTGAQCNRDVFTSMPIHVSAETCQ